jgi:hypothetical protein
VKRIEFVEAIELQIGIKVSTSKAKRNSVLAADFTADFMFTPSYFR